MLTVGQSFSVAANHDGVNTTGYRVYVDNVQVGGDVLVSQLQAGVVTIPSLLAGARGAHTVTLAAFNEDSEARGVPVSFTVKKPAPNAPTGIRILVTVVLADNGTITLKVAGVEAVR